MDNIKTKQGKGKIAFSLLLFLFFPFSVSAQIFTKDKASLFISENTLVSQNLKPNEKVVSETYVYVVKGTIITNLQQQSDIKIAYTDYSEKKGKICNCKQKIKHEKRISNSVKKQADTKKYFYSKNEKESQTSLHKSHNSGVIAFSSSNGNKLSANVICNSFRISIPIGSKYIIQI